MVFRVIVQALAPLTLAAAVFAFLLPGAFLWLGGLFLPLFAVTMLALGLVLDPAEARESWTRPGPIAVGVVGQFTVMPLLGFAGARLIQAAGGSAELALGFLIVGCAPGAMASNVMVYLAGGMVAYSVALTTVATFLAPVLTPWLVELLGDRFLPVPFWDMAGTILAVVVLPLAAGMVLRPRLGRWRGSVQEAAPALAALAIVAICAYAMAANADRIAGIGPLTLGLVVALNGLGYLGGWLVGFVAVLDARHRRTLAIELGMQNAGLGVALALAHFGPEAALPGALFAVWCILTAAAATTWLRRTGRARAV